MDYTRSTQGVDGPDDFSQCICEKTAEYDEAVDKNMSGGGVI